jgi:predicted transcriptional regulator of viral defense system
LANAGVTSKVVEHRLKRGTLVPIHRGVYAVGHTRLTSHGFWMAASLAAGRGAVLSHRDAAALHGIRPCNRPTVEVSTPTSAASTPKLTVYARRRMVAAERTTVDGIPVTTVERTLVDLACVLPQHQLRKALAEAERMRLVDARALAACLQRTRGRAGGGHRRLTAALAEQVTNGPQLTRSEAEDLFLDVVIEGRLARPQMNERIVGEEVDAVWRDLRVAVEVDSRAFHSSPTAQARDRAKSNRLAVAGWRLLRFTWSDLTHDRAGVVAKLNAVGVRVDNG